MSVLTTNSPVPADELSAETAPEISANKPDSDKSPPVPVLNTAERLDQIEDEMYRLRQDYYWLDYKNGPGCIKAIRHQPPDQDNEEDTRLRQEIRLLDNRSQQLLAEWSRLLDNNPSLLAR